MTPGFKGALNLRHEAAVEHNPVHRCRFLLFCRQVSQLDHWYHQALRAPAQSKVGPRSIVSTSQNGLEILVRKDAGLSGDQAYHRIPPGGRSKRGVKGVSGIRLTMSRGPLEPRFGDSWSIGLCRRRFRECCRPQSGESSSAQAAIGLPAGRRQSSLQMRVAPTHIQREQDDDRVQQGTGHPRDRIAAETLAEQLKRRSTMIKDGRRLLVRGATGGGGVVDMVT